VRRQVIAYARDDLLNKVPLEIWTPRTKVQDHIILLGEIEHHLYVVLIFSRTETGFVADGQNIAFDCPEILYKLSNIVGCKLKPLKFDQQTNIDYCESSGASIALEPKIA